MGPFHLVVQEVNGIENYAVVKPSPDGFIIFENVFRDKETWTTDKERAFEAVTHLNDEANGKSRFLQSFS